MMLPLQNLWLPELHGLQELASQRFVSFLKRLVMSLLVAQTFGIPNVIHNRSNEIIRRFERFNRFLRGVIGLQKPGDFVR